MSTSDPIKHKSVLSREVLSLIQASYESRGEERDFLIGDFTFGQGGHSFSILEQFSESKILAFDHDRQAFNHAQKLIGETSYGDRLELINDNFVNFEKYLEGRSFNFILIDLGVSTNQILNPERGFSFKNDGPLDMRMDQGLEQTAKDIVNTYSQEELEKILYTFGEESFTKNIVKNILEHREKEEIQTTKELENIIFHSIPKKLRYRRTHPATKTFQALRIFINKELEVLEKTLDKIKQSMKSPSQIAIISFHSLEDRIVKTVFRNWSKQSKSVRLVTKKPVQASRNEKLDNKRSRSAKMRAVKFLSEAEE